MSLELAFYVSSIFKLTLLGKWYQVAHKLTKIVIKLLLLNLFTLIILYCSFNLHCGEKVRFLNQALSFSLLMKRLFQP